MKFAGFWNSAFMILLSLRRSTQTQDFLWYQNKTKKIFMGYGKAKMYIHLILLDKTLWFLFLIRDKLDTACKLSSVNFYWFSESLANLQESNILNKNVSHLNTLGNWLKPVMQSINSRWRRCWLASANGWSVETFHLYCDNKGPTVTIIRVGKYIFGGYTSTSWDGE